MKTINKDIDIFNTLDKAVNAFGKCKVPCMLLKADNMWYLDRSKQAIVNWPALYELIKEK